VACFVSSDLVSVLYDDHGIENKDVQIMDEFPGRGLRTQIPRAATFSIDPRAVPQEDVGVETFLFVALSNKFRIKVSECDFSEKNIRPRSTENGC
jgi:hypothetical protein